MNVRCLTQSILNQVKIMLQTGCFKILMIGIPADRHIGMIGHVENCLNRWQLRTLTMNFQSNLLAETGGIFRNLIQRLSNLCNGLLAGNVLMKRIGLHFDPGTTHIVTQLYKLFRCLDRRF